MDVSVVIVNYNTSRLLFNCLKSIYTQTEGVVCEIIVVDNASCDNSIDMLGQNFPKVITIASSENLGFGRANNLGVKQAKGKYIFLLNSDTILLNNAVKVFHDFMEDRPQEAIGAIGGWLLTKELNPNLSYNNFTTGGNTIKMLWCKFRKKEQFCDHSKPMQVDYVIGADLFMKKSVFEKLDGFDPVYFMYGEESDLQIRMEYEGLQRYIIPGTKIIHLDGGSFDKEKSFSRFMLSQKSRSYYIRKHLRGIAYWTCYLVDLFFRLQIIRYDWTLKQKIQFYKSVLLQK